MTNKLKMEFPLKPTASSVPFRRLEVVLDLTQGSLSLTAFRPGQEADTEDKTSIYIDKEDIGALAAVLESMSRVYEENKRDAGYRNG